MQFPHHGGGGGLTSLRHQLSNPDTVLWGLIGANVAGYLLWRSNPALMSRHAVVSIPALQQGRYWTLVTAAFSQKDFMHLACAKPCVGAFAVCSWARLAPPAVYVCAPPAPPPPPAAAANMIALFFFARDIGRLFGGQRLLLLYLAGGVAGSL